MGGNVVSAFCHRHTDKKRLITLLTAYSKEEGNKEARFTNNN